MSNPAKQIVLGAARLVGTTMVCERLPRTRDKSAASGAAVPSDARQLSGNEASALPPSDATPTRDTPPLAPPAVLRKVKLQDTSMSTPQPQPPLRPGDRVRYIYDYDHIEIVESCELTAEAVPHWRVVTTWDGHRRIADAKEFVMARQPVLNICQPVGRGPKGPWN
jgi:hypothetical protein